MRTCAWGSKHGENGPSIGAASTHAHPPVRPPPCAQGSKEKEKTKEKLEKWTTALLNEALDVFELARGQGDEGKKVRLR